MAALPELQQRFAQHLLSAEADADAGIRVYRNAVRTNYRNALAATFRVVRELTGAPFFNAAVDAFTHGHPSVSGDLNVYGDAFADFLAAYPHAEALPYLPDVARLEWALDEAARAADATATPEEVRNALAAVPSGELAALRFVLDPSCRLVHSPHPVYRIWEAHQAAIVSEVALDFAAGPDHLLARRTGDAVSVERLPPGDYAWLRALAAGDDLATALAAATAADSTFDLAAVLHARIADRTLAGVRSGMPAR